MDKLLIAVYLCLTVSGLALVKLGSGGNVLFSKVDDKLVWNIGYITILGLACYGLSFMLLMWLVSRFDLSYIIPLTTGLAQFLIFVIAIAVFKEQFTMMKFLAIALIVAGVVLLQIKSGNA